MIVMLSFVQLAQSRITRAEHLSEGTAYIRLARGHVPGALS